MSEEIKNKAAQLTAEIPDEEIEKATGGKKHHREHCQYYGNFVCQFCSLFNTSNCVKGEYDTKYNDRRPK